MTVAQKRGAVLFSSSSVELVALSLSSFFFILSFSSLSGLRPLAVCWWWVTGEARRSLSGEQQSSQRIACFIPWTCMGTPPPRPPITRFGIAGLVDNGVAPGVNSPVKTVCLPVAPLFLFFPLDGKWALDSLDSCRSGVVGMDFSRQQHNQTIPLILACHYDTTGFQFPEPTGPRKGTRMIIHALPSMVRFDQDFLFFFFKLGQIKTERSQYLLALSNLSHI